MAETAVIVSIATVMASGILKDVTMRSVDTLCESSGIGGFIQALFGGLRSDLQLLKRELAKLQALLLAERLKPAQCGDTSTNSLVVDWLRDVQEAAYYADNVLDEMSHWAIRLLVESRTNRSCFLRKLAAFHARIAGKVTKFSSMAQRINEDADEIGIRQVELVGNGQMMSQPSVSMNGDFEDVRANAVASDMVGRKQDEEVVVNKLCCAQDDQGLSAVAIVGMSGIGKTAVARRVYYNEKVTMHFPYKVWVSVSDNFKLKRILNEMLEVVTQSSSNLSNIHAIEDKLHSCLQGKRLLLVLDDMWHIDAEMWRIMKDKLERVGGSVFPQVLVTTQNDKVVSTINASAHALERLSQCDSWILFEREAFADKSPEQKSELKAVGERIASKCNGVPLEIKAMGTLLRDKAEKEEWEAIEGSYVWGSDLGDVEDMVMPSLLLSFNNLPSESAKQCFAYCSLILPRGSSATEGMLVQLWIAQGYLHHSEQRTLEDHGKEIVKVLLQRHLLQIDKYEVSEEVTTFRMDDLMYNLARYISRGLCLVAKSLDELGDASIVKHLCITEKHSYPDTDHIDMSRFPQLKLRSLFCSGAMMLMSRSAIKYLRVLKLTCGLTVFPAIIGRLKHLRYLDLSNNHFQVLPESIGDLGHLQTLKLEHCDCLEELPGNITELINLRHLSTTKHVTLPVGFGQLPNLQELPMINLLAEGWKIYELGCLLNTSGALSIKGVEHIEGKEDAERSNLSSRPKISKLELIWNRERSDEGEYGNDFVVLDGLQPHSNLKSLLVKNYNGKRFPHWLSNMHMFLSLRAVSLLNCEGCDHLPTLGHLPSLQSLKISGLISLQEIGLGFYHKHEIEKKGTVFPKLKELTLQKLRNLQHWSASSLDPAILAFPCLEVLKIEECSELIIAPTHFPSLQQIKLSNCKRLTAFPLTPQTLQSLEAFHVEDCDSLATLPDIYGLSSLTRLVIQKCKNLRHPPNGLNTCTSIETLALSGCPSFDVFPNLARLTRLEKLVLRTFSKQKVIPNWLSGMSHLRSLDIGDLDKDLDTFPDIGLLPVSLRSMYIVGWPKLQSLPSQLSELTQLERLALFRFDGLETLPEWLCEMSSLHILWIWQCKNIRFLPPKDKMQYLDRLRVLSIKKCPLLTERCVIDGAEWDKIAHIHRISIDDEVIQNPT